MQDSHFVVQKGTPIPNTPLKTPQKSLTIPYLPKTRIYCIM